MSYRYPVAHRQAVLSFAVIAVAGAVFATASTAEARPQGPMLFCESYPEAPVCQGSLPDCNFCHTSTAPPLWNGYGFAIKAELAAGDFDSGLAEALRGVENIDSDGDLIDNIDEIMFASLPGDPGVLFDPPEQPEGPDNPSYDVGNYDYPFAYRRVSLLYCGVSPGYDELQTLDGLGELEKLVAVHDKLDECVDSTYWRTFGLRRLADKRIRPIGAVRGLSDYEWDYRLWTWALTDNRDARDLLLADYHVEELQDGTLAKVEGVIAPFGDNGNNGQVLPPERRAGLITTQWFLIINTMFTALPRTSAAQAYRAFLGFDIAKQEGLMPVAGEPLDIDNKGVAQEVCAQCHSTLDPLAYAFARYHGLDGTAGAYNEARPALRIEGWDDNQGVLFGETTPTLRDWAESAAESDAFARNLTEIFWSHALSREPLPHQYDDFEMLWQSLKTDDEYAVNKMLHRLIELDAFGAP